VAEVEIGIGKSGRRAYELDEIAIVPSRRTRDSDDVDVSWEIDAFQLALPIMSAPMDGVSSPATAIALGRLGGVGVLDLEGLWSRYDDPTSLLEEIAGLPDDAVTPRLQELYAAPLQPELLVARIAEIRAAGVIACGAVTPQRLEGLASTILGAELDLLVVHGTVVSAEHVSRAGETLNLKRFVRELDMPVIVGGCSSYQAALHLMRTGAAGVLVGVGAGHASTTRRVLGVGVPHATAIADVRAARMRHLDETGVYVHVIADGGLATGGDIAKAIVCGADAVMVGEPLAAAAEAPGRGCHWGREAAHGSLPKGGRVRTGVRGSLEEVLFGPSSRPDGRINLVGGLRRAMANTGYRSVKEFQKAEVVLASPRAEVAP
jgi:IMP dehydrogenase